MQALHRIILLSILLSIALPLASATKTNLPKVSIVATQGLEALINKDMEAFMSTSPSKLPTMGDLGQLSTRYEVVSEDNQTRQAKGVKLGDTGLAKNELNASKSEDNIIFTGRSNDSNQNKGNPKLKRANALRNRPKKPLLMSRRDRLNVVVREISVREIVYLLVYAFFFMFVIEISMLIVFFFKQNRSYVANHMTLNFFCMLGQTINNIVYYVKKDEFSIKDYSLWYECVIFLLFGVQLYLGHVLNQKLLSRVLVKKIFVLRLLHRLCGVTIYLGTKTHIFLINFFLFYNNHTNLFYILTAVGVSFYVALYLLFFLCLLDVRHYQFDGPYLKDTSKEASAFREMLRNIENGDFEPPNLRESFVMAADNIEDNFKVLKNSPVEDYTQIPTETNELPLKCPHSGIKTSDLDLELNEDPRCPRNVNKEPNGKYMLSDALTESSERGRRDELFFGGKMNTKVNILQPEAEEDIENPLGRDADHLVNPVFPWFMLEDKIFDLRNLRHPKGMYILYGLVYKDITREMYGLKSMRFENKNEKYVKNLRHAHVNRTYHLIKEHCIGSIDTNKNLIVRDKNRDALAKIKKDLRVEKRKMSEKRASLRDDERSINSGNLSRSSYGSRRSLESVGVSSTRNFMEYYDQSGMQNVYSSSWRVHSAASLGTRMSVHFVYSKEGEYLLNMKNYWFRNFGKYYLLKLGDQKQFYYICMASHPKYLARKYLNYALSDCTLLNLLFLRADGFSQDLMERYLGINLLEIAGQYRQKFVGSEMLLANAESDNALQVLNSILPSGAKLGTATPKKIQLLEAAFDLCRETENETPDEISTLDTPMSQYIPLIESPMNRVSKTLNILKKSKEFELKSGLGLGLNLSSFTSKKVLFVAKDSGIIPLLDFIETILQLRVMQVERLARQMKLSRNEKTTFADMEDELELRLKFVRMKVDEMKDRLGIPGLYSDFTKETVRPFDEEYAMSFPNHPEFRIYWQLSSSALAESATQAVFYTLGLTALKEFELVDALARKLTQIVCPERVALANSEVPEDLLSMSENSEISYDSQKSVSFDCAQTESVGWYDSNTCELDVETPLTAVVVNSTRDLRNEFVFGSGVVRCIGKEVEGLKNIAKEVGFADIEKFVLSGDNKFVNRVLSKSKVPLKYITIL